MQEDQQRCERLMAAAKSAATLAYAPYSQFSVGAAVLVSSGEVVVGCNVENASYGLTVCAERIALFSAVAQGYCKKTQSIHAMAIYGAACAQGAVLPCGACLQVMSEFLSPETPIYVYSASGAYCALTLSALLPHPFTQLA